MKDIYKINIELATLNNNKFRKILYTDNNQQLVLMSLLPSENIPKEKHENSTQFIRIESGSGIIIYGNNQRKILKNGTSIIIPKNTYHEIKNTSTNKSLKLYTIYSPLVH
jgi:mannose-6-phosphate isomerase-like protein (cupin superfamily)